MAFTVPDIKALLYDCTKLHDTSYFQLPDTINCTHDMHTSNDSLQFFKASVHEPFLACTAIMLAKVAFHNFDMAQKH